MERFYLCISGLFYLAASTLPRGAFMDLLQPMIELMAGLLQCYNVTASHSNKVYHWFLILISKWLVTDLPGESTQSKWWFLSPWLGFKLRFIHLGLCDIRGCGMGWHVMARDCMQVWCCDPSAGGRGSAWEHKAPGAIALNWRGRWIKSRLMSRRCVQQEEGECSVIMQLLLFQEKPFRAGGNWPLPDCNNLCLIFQMKSTKKMIASGAGAIFQSRKFQGCRQPISSRLQPLKLEIHQIQGALVIPPKHISSWLLTKKEKDKPFFQHLLQEVNNT